MLYIVVAAAARIIAVRIIRGRWGSGSAVVRIAGIRRGSMSMSIVIIIIRGIVVIWKGIVSYKVLWSLAVALLWSHIFKEVLFALRALLFLLL